jgi:hypothetical protein
MVLTDEHLKEQKHHPHSTDSQAIYKCGYGDKLCANRIQALRTWRCGGGASAAIADSNDVLSEELDGENGKVEEDCCALAGVAGWLEPNASSEAENGSSIGLSTEVDCWVDAGAGVVGTANGSLYVFVGLKGSVHIKSSHCIRTTTVYVSKLCGYRPAIAAAWNGSTTGAADTAGAAKGSEVQ